MSDVTCEDCGEVMDQSDVSRHSCGALPMPGAACGAVLEDRDGRDPDSACMLFRGHDHKVGHYDPRTRTTWTAAPFTSPGTPGPSGSKES